MNKQKYRLMGRKWMAMVLISVIMLSMLYPILYTNGTHHAMAATNLSNPSINNGVTTWDCVWFGNYYQDDITRQTKEPIKWRVLSVNGNDAFLMADKNLDAQPFHTNNEAVTWETSTLRAWLNGTFLNKAFTLTVFSGDAYSGSR